MSDANKGENHPHFGKTGENHPMFGKCRAEGAGRPSQAIEVLDLNTNQTTTYESIREAARALSISQNSISQYFSKNQQKPCKRRYVFKKLS
jgi:1,6-anhydro-N-acetylmuramate kinase